MQFPQSQVIAVTTAVEVEASGTVDGVRRHGPIDLTKGRHAVDSGATLTFPAGSHAPHVEDNPVMSGAAWTSPLLQLGGRPDHALAATYGVLLATVLGAMGLPHILVRFYTNRDGQAARRTTAFVLLLLGFFYIFPAVFAVLGRMEAPGLYTSGQTDSVVLVLPRIMAGGQPGHRPRCARGRRGLRRLPLDLVGTADQHVRRPLARHHGRRGQGVPPSAIAIGA